MPFHGELSEGMFLSLLEAAPDAMVIADGEGRLVVVNHQAEAVFGYGHAEMLGQPVEMLMPERFRAAHVGHRAGYGRIVAPRAMGAALELFALRKDGSEFPVEISLNPLRTGHGTFVIAAIRDVTARRNAEAALRAQSVSRPLVMRIVRALSRQLDVPLVAIAEIGRHLARDLHERDIEGAVEAFCSMGLGRLQIAKHGDGVYTFVGEDLLERREGSSQPTCHLALGFLEGAVGAVHGARGLGTELHCQSLGHPQCVFVVKPRA